MNIHARWSFVHASHLDCFYTMAASLLRLFPKDNEGASILNKNQYAFIGRVVFDHTSSVAYRACGSAISTEDAYDEAEESRLTFSQSSGSLAP